jgi:hypothetical protein
MLKACGSKNYFFIFFNFFFLPQVEVQMVESKFDLDITLCVKQGQVEVDQAAVVTNYSDAQVVRSASIQPKLNDTKLQ